VFGSLLSCVDWGTEAVDRVAVFVDAGYLFAAGGRLLVGRRVPRGELSLDVGAVEQFLREFAEAETGLPLLRIYWYDGTDSGPTADHTRLMWTQNVKVRLGIVNNYGEQKGVDSLVVSDMINLARSGNVASCVLLTGDEDLRVGVQQAQEAGLRVHLVGIEPRQQNQSNMLQQEADIRHELGQAQIGRFLSIRTRVGGLEVHVPDGASRDQTIAAVVRAVVDSLDAATRTALRLSFDTGERRVPREHDHLLLKTLGDYLGAIEERDKWNMREMFRDSV